MKESNKYPNIPQTYKGFEVEVVHSIALDMNNSPAGWLEEKTILVADWFANMNPPKELVCRILDHEIKERAIVLQMSGDLQSTLFGSLIGREAHNKLIETDSTEKETTQMYLNFLRNKSRRLYELTIASITYGGEAL